MARKGKRVKAYIPLFFVGWYFYGMFINSIRLGIASTFHRPDAPEIETIWIADPVKNFLVVFSSTGLAVTFFCVLMICLITKKGYNWFSGYKFKRDPRGFDILPDATHGTSGWMDRKEMEQVVDLGSTAEMQGILLGKLKDGPDDDDKYSEYVAPSPKNHLNSHIIIYGASGSGKTRGIIKPFIMQAIKRGESLVCVDPKGELFESTSQYARDNGAVVKAFNLLDKENSDGINFLAGIEEDNTLIQTIAETIIKNTSNANERQDFWEKAELNLLCALLHYVQRQEDPRTHQALPIEQRAIGDIYKILSTESITDLETRFADLPKGHPALAPYGLFKQANRQIWGNIAIGLGNRLSVFQDELIDKITRYNDIDLLLPG